MVVAGTIAAMTSFQVKQTVNRCRDTHRLPGAVQETPYKALDWRAQSVRLKRQTLSVHLNAASVSTKEPMTGTYRRTSVGKNGFERFIDCIWKAGSKRRRLNPAAALLKRTLVHTLYIGDVFFPSHHFLHYASHVTISLTDGSSTRHQKGDIF